MTDKVKTAWGALVAASYWWAFSCYCCGAVLRFYLWAITWWINFSKYFAMALDY